MKKKKELPFYIATTGFYEAKVKICFSDEAFQAALKHSKITVRHTSLDCGVAESHYIQQEGTQNVMLAIVFDLKAMEDYDSLERIGVIVHECVHTVTHVFEHIGEDEAKIGDETRAYFTEYLFKQVFAAFATEQEKYDNVRERDRAVSEQVREKIERAMLQMDKLSDGSAGQDSISEPKSVSSGTKNADRKTKRKTKTSI
jgi:hypothetical protein